MQLQEPHLEIMNIILACLLLWFFIKCSFSPNRESSLSSNLKNNINIMKYEKLTQVIFYNC